jgi:hypothetical protein
MDNEQNKFVLQFAKVDLVKTRSVFELHTDRDSDTLAPRTANTASAAQ